MANPVAYPLAAAGSRHSVRGIGSLAVAYGGASAVRCALSVCCIAPNYVVYVVYPHSSPIVKFSHNYFFLLFLVMSRG